MKVRPIWLIAAAFVIVSLFGCGGSESAVVPTETPAPRMGPNGPILPALTAGRQVLAPDGRYSMFVPPDWVDVNIGLSEVSFRTLEADSDERFTLSVSRETLDGVRQPQVYAEAGRRTITRLYSNVVTLSMTPVQVGDIPAYRWMYTATAGGAERLYYQLFLIDGVEGFVVTGSAPVDSQHSEVQRLFDSIAGSISFARG